MNLSCLRLQTRRRSHRGLMALVLALVLAPTMVLTGCGYHLRGSVNLPEALTPVAVEARSGTQGVARRLQQRLGNRLAQPGDQPGLRVRLSNLRRDEQQTLYVGDDGSQFSQTLSVRVDAMDASGSAIWVNQRVSATTDYVRDKETLTRPQQQQQLQTQLEQELAEQLLNRIAALKTADPSQP